MEPLKVVSTALISNGISVTAGHAECGAAFCEASRFIPEWLVLLFAANARYQAFAVEVQRKNQKPRVADSTKVRGAERVKPASLSSEAPAEIQSRELATFSTVPRKVTSVSSTLKA
ncbi:hypothetical protein SAMN05216372_105224 [Pseudomonas straminea]|uniref:Uncharacterized protein n=1 Tax=Pseudomonas straminea TaxID=47882 RepID=A0A1I1W490_PSEOC|nr:hypothetical protein SAMN05216372_105224 [Pseudomonas straminea]